MARSKTSPTATMLEQTHFGRNSFKPQYSATLLN